jgi:hypothetical protein
MTGRQRLDGTLDDVLAIAAANRDLGKPRVSVSDDNQRAVSALDRVRRDFGLRFWRFRCSEGRFRTSTNRPEPASFRAFFWRHAA